MSQKIAVVTGANKGIGYAIVKGLAPKFNGLVYLTARNEELGNKALSELNKLGLTNIRYHQLDIDNQQSIDNFAKYIKDKYQGLDVLINNAAIAFKAADPAPFSEQARVTNRINFTGTLNLSNALFSLLRPHARVVNVSSRAGLLRIIKDESLRNKFSSQEATADDIKKLIDNFISLAQTGTHESAGYPNSSYGMSKLGLTAVTRVHQRMFDKDTRQDILVNALCPGYCDTDMSSHKGHLTPEQGAETPIHLALIPENAAGPKGEFLLDNKPYNWEDSK